ncbi:RNA methyltransferase [Haloglomus irregulare]|uniref:RNA methyltransferase n=1 Tax=Haloglomus irregulare TaxID=2234134 RepID=A0A554NCU7_9EURY|nr:TrmJ/YjtD family RNA methyltransferase [Haloglomus irregulare]TSD15204.1 RNA methyltransferase [Haloglomus irregulare]
MSPDISVAVVDAETPGNVGTIARAMKNFGLSELLLVDPPELDPEGEAYGMAGHAREDVLPNAREVTFDHLVGRYHTVGCTAVTGEDARRHVRYPFRTPADLAASLGEVEADTCVVFGRERVGLTNEELGRLDEVCAIPASEDYPVLNLGQAATVVLYELRDLTVETTQLPDGPIERAAEAEIEGLHEEFARYLRNANHPAEKRPKARRLLRRVLGRAHPTGREVRTLRGILRRGNGLLEHPERLRVDGSEREADER